jgi:hypothetical protein
MPKDKIILWIIIIAVYFVVVGLLFLNTWYWSKDKTDLIGNITPAALSFIFIICVSPLQNIRIWPPPKVDGDKQQVARAHYLHYRRVTNIVANGLAVMFTVLLLARLIISFMLTEKYRYLCLTPSLYGLILILIAYCFPWAIFYLTYGLLRVTRQKA